MHMQRSNLKSIAELVNIWLNWTLPVKLSTYAVLTRDTFGPIMIAKGAMNTDNKSPSEKLTIPIMIRAVPVSRRAAM